jgi:hypothetical protein
VLADSLFDNGGFSSLQSKMPISQRPEVPRLSSTYLRSLATDDLAAAQLDASDIPSCGVDIMPRSRYNENVHVIVTPQTTRKLPPKQHSAAKNNDDDDDDSSDAAPYKNPILEHEEKTKSDRQLKGREFAKEQRKRWRLDALKLKEEAELDKRKRAERLAALGKKARKFASDPMPEHPRQQLAKSRSEVKRKNEVYISPEDQYENENDVSIYALQWALGDDAAGGGGGGGKWEEKNRSSRNETLPLPDSFDLHSERDLGSIVEYSAESKGGDSPTYLEDETRALQKILASKVQEMHDKITQHSVEEDENNDDDDDERNDGEEGTKNKMKSVRINQNQNQNQKMTATGTGTGEEKSIFEQGMINNMGRIPAQFYTHNVPKKNTKSTTNKAKKSAPAIKMFYPSYKQEPPPTSKRPKASTYTQNRVRSNPEPKTPIGRDGRVPPNLLKSPATVVKVVVRDTKGNIVKEILRPNPALTAVRSGKSEILKNVVTLLFCFVEAFIDIDISFFLLFHLFSLLFNFIFYLFLFLILISSMIFTRMLLMHMYIC